MSATKGPGGGPRSDRSDASCPCTEDTSTSEPLAVDCRCPRDDHDVVVHEQTCLLYRNEAMVYEQDPRYCECLPFETELCFCCGCATDKCSCEKPGKKTFDEWRDNRDLGEMPAVLESTHPLMQKFQESLRRFLEKENEMAQQEITILRDDLRLKKEAYERDLEGVYRSDHDTNGQRVLIKEYEDSLANETKARLEAQERARVMNEKYTRCKEKLDADLRNERDSSLELDSLTALVQQMEKWREETESDLTISQRMTEKMRQEKKERADEKRQMDMLLYAVNNEIWKMQSRMELYKKQMELKNAEMDKITDKVIAYGTELEDLELDKKRLTSLWNSVLVNIKRRDNVFDLVREDYKNLQENYRTLMTTLGITKKVAAEELEKSKSLAMERDKLHFDTTAATKLFEVEDERRQQLERQIVQVTESIEMMEGDEAMLKTENTTLKNIYTSTEKEYMRRVKQKIALENQVLRNLEDCLLNDKAVEAMSNGIKKMREMSRKLEVTLAELECRHAKVLLTIELQKNKQLNNEKTLEKYLEKVKEKETAFEDLQKDYDEKTSLITTKQREFDLVLKKYSSLKEVYDMKSPQQRRIDEMEGQIRSLRNRTEILQQEWLRLQGHVVNLTTQFHKVVADIGLLNKQIQICDQKKMHTESQLQVLNQERTKVARTLRDLCGRLEMLTRARKQTKERNEATQNMNHAVSYEYTANLKDAEHELMQMEEEIEMLDKEKNVLTQDLDHLQREALVWQRKGIQAMELRRSIHEAKSTAGEIGQMKSEIHRMEVRRDQLRRTADKLSEDLSLYVMRRESAIDKTRASAALEKARGCASNTTQFSYKHKLRLAKADVGRVTKELAEAKDHLNNLQSEQVRLQKEVNEANVMNTQLEERVAQLLRDIQDAERNKQWLLERVVRSQRLGTELSTAVKRQSLRIKKPKKSVLVEYKKARELNDRLRYINETLLREYPYLEEKFLVIFNTLNIESPSSSPRLLEEAPCDHETDLGERGCVIPEEDENVAEKPFCS